MDIDAPQPTASSSRSSTSTSTPRPSSAGVKLPGIRTLPGFQINQHELASGSGLGSSSSRDSDWISVREREAIRDREALREMDWEREREREREREGLRGYGSGIGSGTGGGMGYDGYSSTRTSLGKERELSLPMSTPISRPLPISSSAVMAMSMTPTEDRPRSGVYTSSATLNSILSVPAPSEPFSHTQARPHSAASRSLSSPSPFAHGLGGNGLPPIGHGLLASGRRRTAGVSEDVGTAGGGGGGPSGGRWSVAGYGMSPTLPPARSPTVATSSASSSSLAHLYAVASASGSYPVSTSISVSRAHTMSASRPSSSHASTSASVLGMNGYSHDHGRSRADSTASANTSTSGSMTPTSHHRMAVPSSPPMSASSASSLRHISHPRPQAYVAPPPPHRALMSPPPLPESRRYDTPTSQIPRVMSPPAPASTPVSLRGNVNPYLAARVSPSVGSPYTASPQLESLRIDVISPLPNDSSTASRTEVRSALVPPRLGLASLHEDAISRAHTSSSLDTTAHAQEVMQLTGQVDKRRSTLEEPTTKEALRLDVDIEMEETGERARASSSSRAERISSSPTAVSSSLEIPTSTTPNTRHETLRPPSSSPLPHLPSSSSPTVESSSPAKHVPPYPGTVRRTSSNSHLQAPPSPSRPSVQETLVHPAETLIPDDSIRCICGISIDDGFSIACDVCSRWCHTACFKIEQESVPEEWVCWVCASSSPNPSNGHATGGGGGRGKGRGKGKGTATSAGASSKQWTPWTKEKVEERRVWARAMQMARSGLAEVPGGGLVRVIAGDSADAGAMMAPPVDVLGASGKRERRSSALPPFHQHQQDIVSAPTPAHDGPVGLNVEGSPGAGATNVGVAGGIAEVPAEEEDPEPWTSTYVSITQDVITDPETRVRLRRHAQRWRGVSALTEPGDNRMDVDGDGLGGTDALKSQRPVRVESMPDPDAPSVAVRPLIPLARGGSAQPMDVTEPSASTPNPIASASTPVLPPSSSHTLASASFAYNPLVLPPSYSLHTTSPIPSKTLIAPFVSHITPSSTYLADPLNAYVHLGMPKPYVHLLGPPLEVALDARGVGGKARFARRGCWPNAVVRPVLCERGKAAPSQKGKEKSTDEDSGEDDGTQLAFGVFALRDLKAGEEVVLGWEWDDGHVIHKLPALLQTPSIVSSTQVPHIKDQMANLLHALASNFVACACGARVQLGEGCTGHHDRHEQQRPDQPHRQYENGHYYDAESGPGIHHGQYEIEEVAPRGRTRERVSVREKRMRQKEKQQSCALASMARFVGEDGLSHEHTRLRPHRIHDEEREEIDLGPLVGASAKTGIRTREGKFGGVESVYSVHGELRHRQSREHGQVHQGEPPEVWPLHGGQGIIGSVGRQGRHVDTQLSTSVEEPRPPDPRLRLPLRVNKAVNGIRDVESQMPPKIRMRKRWTQTHGQGDVPLYEREDISMQTSVPAPILAAGSMDVDDDTTPQASENGRVGLGIRLEGQPAPVSTTTLVRGPSPQPTSPTSPLVDADRGLKLTSTMSQMLMPPPPLPISRDTSTTALTSTPVSALESSPVHKATWPHNTLRSPPRSPGSPIIVSTSSLPRRTSTSSDGESQASVPTPPPPSSALSTFSPGSLVTNSPSPLVSFANLSLLSPAILNQVRMHAQNQNTARASAQLTPDHSLLSPFPHTSTNASYFPAQAASSATEPIYPSHAHPPPEPSPLAVSFDMMTLNRDATASPIQGTKDEKVWSPLQRRSADSLVGMSESRRSPMSDTSEPRDHMSLSPPTESSPESHQTSEAEPAEEIELVVPSKDLNPTETCENGIRVEYLPAPESPTNHTICAEATREFSVSPEEVNGALSPPDANSPSRSQTPSRTMAETAPMDVEVDRTQSPDLESTGTRHKAETETHSDEAEDIEFPSHRWRRKRKRIVSMDSEAGRRSHSPPHKVARDSEVQGVDVHTSPSPHRERSVPLPPVRAGSGAVAEDADMQDIQARPLAEAQYTTLVRADSPVQLTNGGPQTRLLVDAEVSEPMTLDDAAPLFVKDTSPVELTVAPVHPESIASITPVTSVVPAPEPSPQPEAPRKVKLSLADFARRKKQQRQEEERQLELQRALNPPPPPSASPPLPEVQPLVTEPPSVAKDTLEQAVSVDRLPTEPQLQLPPVTKSSSPKPHRQVSDMVKDVPILDTAVVNPAVKEIAEKDPSPAPSPMSVSPEESAPPPIKFGLATAAEKSSPLVPGNEPSLSNLDEREPTPSAHSLPATLSSSTVSTPTPTPVPQINDRQERQAKQERIEAIIPPPPPPSGKPSRFGPPLARPLVGLVVHPPTSKANVPTSASGLLGPPDHRSLAPAQHHALDMPSLPPHARRHSQSQEDGEIRENVPPSSPAPTPPSSRHTWFGRPLPDPPSDPKDLKGWNQYYREVYNLTGSFDPPGVAVRPGMHPPPKGPRSLANHKGESTGNANGNAGGQTSPLVSAPPSRASLPIPTGPRFGVRPGARALIPDDATRAALAKAKADAEHSTVSSPVPTPLHSQSPVIPPGPPPLSARIGPPIPRGASVDHGDRDGRDDGERRGGRDYRPYARGRGRGGGGVWRK